MLHSQSMPHVMLFPTLHALYLYISTFPSLCAAPNMAVFCSSLISCFPICCCGSSRPYYCWYHFWFYILDALNFYFKMYILIYSYFRLRSWPHFYPLKLQHVWTDMFPEFYTPTNALLYTIKYPLNLIELLLLLLLLLLLSLVLDFLGLPSENPELSWCSPLPVTFVLFLARQPPPSGPWSPHSWGF